MKIIITDGYDKISEEAFRIMKDVVVNKPNAILGLATGSSPVGMYKLMAEDCKKNGTSYKNITSVNLDEYVGLDETNDQSYVYFMRDNLFNHIDIDLKNTHLANGKAADMQAECDRYNKMLEGMQQDIQVLGIGSDGHIAFNEPGTPLDSLTHVVDLTEQTIRDNARFFASINDVPRQAVTMGLKNIMQAKKIIILANGEHKAEAIKGMIKGPVCPECPASVLQLHPDVTVIIDKAAASLL